MLTLDLVPGDRLGPFALGLAVGEVLELVAENAAEYSRVEVKLGEDPTADILCSFPAHGFSLRFDAHTQALRLVEVHDPSRLQLRYKGEVIGGSTPVTLSSVSALFGPTFPGEVCAEDTLALHYRGLVFLFAQTTAAPDVSAARIVLCAPAAHAGTHMRLEAVLAAAPPVTSPPVAPLVATMGFGLRLPSGAELPFGCSLQDLVAELGPPSSSMVKASDAMLIHASAQTPGPSGLPYFLTWQHRGLDALIDGEVWRISNALAARLHYLTDAQPLDAPLRQVRAAYKPTMSHVLRCICESCICAGDAGGRTTWGRCPLAGASRTRPWCRGGSAACMRIFELCGLVAGSPGCTGAQRTASGQHGRRTNRRRRPRRSCTSCRFWSDVRLCLQRGRLRGAAQWPACEPDAFRAVPGAPCCAAAVTHGACGTLVKNAFGVCTHKRVATSRSSAHHSQPRPR